MCVAIPAKIISVKGLTAMVEVGGVSRQISMQLTPEAKKGDYVLGHAGFAFNIVDEMKAQETLKLFAELERLNSAENL